MYDAFPSFMPNMRKTLNLSPVCHICSGQAYNVLSEKLGGGMMNRLRAVIDDIKDDVNQENSSIIDFFGKVLSSMSLVLLAAGLPYLAYLYLVSGL
jgi:hypothetical protein